MSRFILLTTPILLFPIFVSAQTLSIQSFITTFITFSNRVIVPFLIGIAFLFFVINIIRFFVVQGASEDGRKNAKNLAIYSVVALVVIVVFWGVVNLLASSIGLGDENAPTPDYLEKRNVEFKNEPRSATDSNHNDNTAGSDPIGDIIRDSSDPCSSGGSFDNNGNPCGIY